MGTLLRLSVKKRLTEPRKWSRALFIQRARQSQDALEAICRALKNDQQRLRGKQQMEYHHYAAILERMRTLSHLNEAWSAILYNEERLPFDVWLRRYPALSACYHVRQDADAVMHLLKEIGISYRTTPDEEPRLRQQCTRAMATLLQSGRNLSYSMTALLDEVRFGQQRSCSG
jgi:hypothetical protein